MPNDKESAAPDSPWLPIYELPESDDLFWFLRWDSAGGYSEDGPRPQQLYSGDEDDGWQWFAPAESPPYKNGANT